MQPAAVMCYSYKYFRIKNWCVPLSNGAEAFKILPSGRWIPVSDALIEGRVLTYTVVDNGPLDIDRRQGFISDPVTVAVPVAPVPVPTLPGAMIGLLVLLMAMLGWKRSA